MAATRAYKTLFSDQPTTGRQKSYKDPKMSDGFDICPDFFNESDADLMDYDTDDPLFHQNPVFAGKNKNQFVNKKGGKNTPPPKGESDGSFDESSDDSDNSGSSVNTGEETPDLSSDSDDSASDYSTQSDVSDDQLSTDDSQSTSSSYYSESNSDETSLSEDSDEDDDDEEDDDDDDEEDDDDSSESDDEEDSDDTDTDVTDSEDEDEDDDDGSRTEDETEVDDGGEETSDDNDDGVLENAMQGTTPFAKLRFDFYSNTESTTQERQFGFYDEVRESTNGYSSVKPMHLSALFGDAFSSQMRAALRNQYRPLIHETSLSSSNIFLHVEDQLNTQEEIGSRLEVARLN